MKKLLLLLVLAASPLLAQVQGSICSPQYLMLSSVQVLALNTTAQIYDGCVEPHSIFDVYRVFARFKPKATGPVAYTVPAGTVIEIFEGNDTGCGVPATGLLDQSTSKFVTVDCTLPATATNGLKNNPLTIKLTNAVTGGNGTLEIYVYYTLIPFGS